MILGINWGLLSIKGELGAGISDRCIASADASSTSSVKRVKTLLTRKAMISTLISRKITNPRRILSRSCLWFWRERADRGPDK